MSLNLGTAVAILTLDISGFEQGFREAQDAMSGFGSQSSTTSSKFQSVGNALTSVGGTLTSNVTMPIVDLGAKVLNTGMDFEYAMSQVEKTVQGKGNLTAEEFKKQFAEMELAARKMGRDTKFTAVDAATALEKMGMAGWDMGEMMAGLQPILDLAIAGNENLTLTSDIVTDALTAFGLEAKDTGHFCDVLAQASMFSNTNVGMMGESFKYAAGTASSMGFSMEDTALALGLMANAGIKSSMAGTSLRSVMTNLAHPVGQSKEAVEGLGLQLLRSDGQAKSFKEIMEELRNKLGGIKAPAEEVRARVEALDTAYQEGSITEEQYTEQMEALMYSLYGTENAHKAEYAAMLAGKTGMAGLLAIITAGQDDYNDLSNAIKVASVETDGMTASQKMASIAQDNGRTDVDKLISSLSDLAISVYKLVEGPFRDFVVKITEVVDWFNDLDDEVKNGIVQFFLFIAAIGPLLSALGTVVKGVGLVVSIFKGLGSIIEVVMAVVGGGGAAAGGSGLLGVLGSLAEFLIGGLVSAISAFVAAVGTIPAIIIAVIAAIVAVFVILYKKWDKFRDLINKVAKAIKDFVLDIPENVGKAIQWLGEKTSEMIDDITSFGKKMVEKAKKIGGDFIDSLMNAIKLLPELIRLILNKVIEVVKKWIIGMIDAAKGVFDFVMNIVDIILQLPGKILIILSNIIKDVVDWGIDLLRSGVDAATGFLEGIIDLIKMLPGDMWEYLADALKKVVEFGASLVKFALDIAKEFVDGFLDGVSKIGEGLLKLGKIIVEKIKEIGRDLFEAGKDLVDFIADGIKAAIGVVSSAIQWVIDEALKVIGIKNDVKGSTKNNTRNPRAVGVDYVPYNGYGATLHEGEMVLTRQEAEEYRKGNMRTNGNGDTYIFNSPEPIDERQAARLLKQTKRELAMGF